MGGADKGRLLWENSSRVEAVIERLTPQVDSLVISANRNLEWYESLGYPVYRDELTDFAGPLAGIAACLSQASADLFITAPCDSPLLPIDLVDRMQAALTPESDACCVHDGERFQYLFLGLRPRCISGLSAYLDAGERSVKGWLQQLAVETIDYSDQPEAFLNLNE